ncbi:Murein DD-endopeptidase MepM and murein hydrolase activator NlpD, contain LysM domain [Parasphingorhabdus marina DSM 22363]|uniref:Murein DD-endopeptidase MepM and murein hydrolase activator NlpD, contain LysM domain n=1 Tax=Parasphingorhabdus marina DSM 22363 TaxID=1123272 RepID=A0A1N6D5V0_9SPHN|nr:M23 family metallopeptidase [Parasphingorhabdus marina]SIN66155.1 Murein DD-endopeptidase MepM and murein hydrolase activator NlpD, contain LysM domain [Parasphingorhabdus marina DSM 22363]
MRNLILLVLAGTLSACIPPGQDYSWPQNEAVPDTAPDRVPMLRTDEAAFGSARIDSQPAPWQARGVVPVALDVEDMTYVVKPGDTLRGIANTTGAGSQIIAKKNGLVAPYVINPGQRLSIPGGRYHRVSSGETGIAIARAYGVPWREVVDLNGLEEPYVLRVGQKLLLPASAPADPVNMSLEQRAAAFRLDIDDIVTGGQPALADPASQVTVSPPPSDWRKAVMPEKRVAPPSAFAGRFNWPVEGKLLSGFGSKGGGVVNDGLNIAVSEGTPIRAAADGVVAYSGDEIDVFGGLILINHGSGWVTAYGHAARLNVERGEKVRAGDVIGLAGESGYVEEPQLHFEIRKNRKPVDPALHLPKRT